MQIWQEIVKAALVGTEHNMPSFPEGEGVESLLSQLDTAEKERAVLLAGGVLTTVRRAGLATEAVAGTLPDPAPETDKPLCPNVVASDLYSLLADVHKDLLPEWLAAVAEKGWRVPSSCIPHLLMLSRQPGFDRRTVLPVLGERGRWLAAQNPDWTFAGQRTLFEDAASEEATDPELWETGTRAERAAFLERLRGVEPDRARELVQEVWSKEGHEERAAFLKTFAVGLSMADEPFLEAALDDKRKEVRTNAVDLLVCLPESRLCLRMQDRAAPLLSLKPDTAKEPAKKKPETSPLGLLKRVFGKELPELPVDTMQLDVSLPREFDKAMLRDGLDGKPGAAINVAQRAGLLTSLLAAVPLGFWEKQFQRTPMQLLAINQDKSSRDDVLQGWVQSVVRQKNRAWAEALLAYWLSSGTYIFRAGIGWLALLPKATVEEAAVQSLENDDQALDYSHRAYTLLNACEGIWSVRLTDAFLKRLRTEHENSNTQRNFYINQIVSVAAEHTPPEKEEDLYALWETTLLEGDYHRNLLNESRSRAAFRREMLRHIKEN